jgi:tRNA (cytosine40_48-C5)-methyltransferase
MSYEIMDSDLFHNEYSKMLAEKYGYKDWMISRFLNFVPDTESLLEYVENNRSHNFEYIRANNLKIESQELKRRLTEKGYWVRDTILKEVFMVEKTKDDTNSTKESRKNIGLPSVGSTLEYLKGYYYIQDLSSCIAVDELEINENSCLTVLDMASSPGGKTTFMAQKMGNGGKIIACEPNTKRIPSLIFNLSRCNVKNTSIFNIFGEDIGTLAIRFDRILLDAPCTCEGIITKDETRKKSRNLKDIEICSNRQKKLVRSALEVLKPSGIMIYCTCSFAPEENEMIIDDLMRNNKDEDIELMPLKYGVDGLTEFDNHQFAKDISKTRRLYPHIHNTNGFYIAKLRKK